MRNIARDKKGFTLVEIAIVMVIIGMLVGLGSSMIGPLMSLSKTRESKEFVGAAVESLNSWAASNNRVPPFTPIAPDTARFDQIAKSSRDAWGRNLIYLYDTNLAPTGAVAVTRDTICGRKTASLTIADNSVTPVVTINNVAYLVISQGDDATTQATLAGTLNGAAINGVITGSGRATGAVTIDANVLDIVRWVTLDELRTKIGCQGAQLQILNNELPSTSLGSTYSATMFAAGGVPNVVALQNRYRWCVEIRNRTIAQGLPNGITLAPNFVRYPDNPAPTYCADQAEAAWATWANNLVITKTAGSTESGSFNMTVFARDNNNAANDTACSTANNNDSCTQKSFVLTISP